MNTSRKATNPDESRLLWLSIAAICTLLATGTVGFTLIEGWRPFDALYMTVITLSTVGFTEVHPLSENGRIFTILLIFCGVGAAAFILPFLAGKVMERQIRWFFGEKNMQKQIDQLRDHTIFCGYGRLCKVAAKDYFKDEKNLLIIDKTPDKCRQAQEAGYLVLAGDATTDETLLAAGIKQAKRLVCMMPKDAENLYVILTSRELNPDIFIISRAEDEFGEKRLLRAGANRVISPYLVSGQRIASGLLRPYVTDFLDLASSSSDSHLLIEELRIPSSSPVVGVSLKDSGIRQLSNVMIAAVISSSGSMTVNPSGETVLEAGATLIGLGKKSDFPSLEKILVGGPSSN